MAPIAEKTRPVETASGPEMTTSATRTISQLEEFRCRRETRVSTGVTPTKATCGAEAWVKVTFPFDLDRYYCAHHANEEWASILGSAVAIHDERDAINAKPSVSAY